jgi:hypothetical protein
LTVESQCKCPQKNKLQSKFSFLVQIILTVLISVFSIGLARFSNNNNFILIAWHFTLRKKIAKKLDDYYTPDSQRGLWKNTAANFLMRGLLTFQSQKYSSESPTTWKAMQRFMQKNLQKTWKCNGWYFLYWTMQKCFSYTLELKCNFYFLQKKQKKQKTFFAIHY